MSTSAQLAVTTYCTTKDDDKIFASNYLALQSFCQRNAKQVDIIKGATVYLFNDSSMLKVFDNKNVTVL